MDLERNDIERKDFPSARKGYDSAEVDRHLRAIADAVEKLKRAAPSSMAGATAQHVEAIVAAAEASAQEIEQRANADAEQTRAQAQADAADHVKRAEEVAGTLAARANELLEQVTGVVGEIGGLQAAVQAMRADVGTAPAAPAQSAGGLEPGSALDPEPALTLESIDLAISEPDPEPEPVLQAVPDPEPEPPAPEPEQAAPEPEPAQPQAAPAAVASAAKPAPEGARLIALNMALSGTPREETARYLRENFELDDQDHLLDDVYAKAGS